MKVLLTGADGQVGSEIRQCAPAAGIELVATDLDTLDIRDESAVQSAVIEARPDWIVNAAAFTAVDDAEERSDAAFSINRDGPSILGKACADHGTRLMHISTDFVFDGRQAHPYVEIDTPSPVNVYGASKWAGDEAVCHQTERYIILRVSWVFSPHGHNFVKTILRLARAREELRVVADQSGCPTAAADVAATILRIITSRSEIPWGLYHYCGAPATTWYEFAKAIVEEGNNHEGLKVNRLEAISTAAYPTKAPRPMSTALDCQKIERGFGIVQPQWRGSLKQTVAELYRG